MSEKNEENKKELEEIQKREGKRNLLTNILKDTTKMSGEFKVNALIIDDTELENMLQDAAEALNTFNKRLNTYLANY